MATNASHGFESDGSNDQTALSTYAQCAAERASEHEECDTSELTVGIVADSGGESGTDQRIKRALTEFFHTHATDGGGDEYLVSSGSNARYVVDVSEHEPTCSCEDRAPDGFCKHVWYLCLFEPAVRDELTPGHTDDIATCDNDVEGCVGVDAVELDADGVPQFPPTEQGVICYDCFAAAAMAGAEGGQ